MKYLKSMGKNKKTINDIQKALLSNTTFIKEKEPVAESIPEPQADKETVIYTVPHNAVVIDEGILKKVKILAAYEKKPPEELIHLAINHFLRLKTIDLAEAMMKITNDES